MAVVWLIWWFNQVLIIVVVLNFVITLVSEAYEEVMSKKIIYIYGISQNEEERAEVINEAKQVLDVEDVVTSIFLVEDLRVVKN